MRIAPLLNLAFSPAAAGQVVFENGGPDWTNGFHSDFDNSSPSNTGQVGDDFVLAAPATFDGATFYGVYAFDNVPPAADDFVLRVFDLTAPPPANAPLVERSLGSPMRTDTGLDVVGFDAFEYIASFDAVVLPAGTYLLSIVNDTTGTTADWFWLTSSPAGSSWERGSDLDPWVQGSRELAFRLTAAAGSSTTTCFGDGSGAPCGCGNDLPTTSGGCENSLGTSAVLTATGMADTMNDTLSLFCSGVRAQPGLFFQGDNGVNGGLGATFGDGIRCCGTNVIRIQVVLPLAPEPATATMTETATTNGPAGTIQPGDTKCYQYWFRDPGGLPCGSGFNLSNAVNVIWS